MRRALKAVLQRVADLVGCCEGGPAIWPVSGSENRQGSSYGSSCQDELVCPIASPPEVLQGINHRVNLLYNHAPGNESLLSARSH